MGTSIQHEGQRIPNKGHHRPTYGALSEVSSVQLPMALPLIESSIFGGSAQQPLAIDEGARVTGNDHSVYIGSVDGKAMPAYRLTKVLGSQEMSEQDMTTVAPPIAAVQWGWIHTKEFGFVPDGPIWVCDSNDCVCLGKK